MPPNATFVKGDFIAYLSHHVGPTLEKFVHKRSQKLVQYTPVLLRRLVHLAHGISLRRPEDPGTVFHKLCRCTQTFKQI